MPDTLFYVVLRVFSIQEPVNFGQQNYEVKFNIASDNPAGTEVLEEFTEADLDKLSELLPPGCLDEQTWLQMNNETSHQALQFNNQVHSQQSQNWMDQAFANTTQHQNLDIYISHNDHHPTSRLLSADLPLLELTELPSDVMVESSLAKLVN